MIKMHDLESAAFQGFFTLSLFYTERYQAFFEMSLGFM